MRSRQTKEIVTKTAPRHQHQYHAVKMYKATMILNLLGFRTCSEIGFKFDDVCVTSGLTMSVSRNEVYV